MRCRCLFLDEIDSFGDRGHADPRWEQYQREVINGFLKCLDGAEGHEGVIVVGATNLPDKIDPAILRPGPLERLIAIPLPDAAARAGIDLDTGGVANRRAFTDQSGDPDGSTIDEEGYLWNATWDGWRSRRRHMPAIVIALFLAVVAWWVAIPPSHDRPWRPEVAVMPRAFVDGDRVHLIGVRNFDYRSRDDFTVRYEEREVLLSRLTNLDFYVSYWSEGPVGHTFLSFIFDNAPPLSISIETRPEVGEGFNPPRLDVQAIRADLRGRRRA